MRNADIPFQQPFIGGKELFYVAQAVTSGRLAADGPFTQRCARLLEAQLGIPKVLLTPSCTAALELAAMLYNLGPGDEVIMPSFTFVSTANAVARLGATPRFIDVRPDTLNLDANLIAAAVNERTRAIWPVHYAGVACDMDAIRAEAQRYGLAVVEDAAHGIHAFYRGQALGSLGNLGAFSFHETKNLTCGEGGALCINDPSLVERAEILRDKGANRQQFLRGEVDKYTWTDIGTSGIMSEICSAYLLGQLEMMEEVTCRRRELHERYCRLLTPLAAEGWVQLPSIPTECASNYHLFHVLLPDAAIRDGLLAHLRKQGIQATFHYAPLHTSPMGQKYGYRKGDLPITEDRSDRLLRLPMYFSMSETEQAIVVREMTRCFQTPSARRIFRAA